MKKFEKDKDVATAKIVIPKANVASCVVQGTKRVVHYSGIARKTDNNIFFQI